MVTKTNGKDTYTKIVVSVSLLLCTVFSGGLGWQYVTLSSMIFLSFLIYKRKRITLNLSVACLLCMIILGITSIWFTSGDKQNAIHEFTKVVCFIMAFFVGKSVSQKTITKSILLVAMIVAAIGILAYCNLIRIDEFVFNDRKLLRLQSFIKYANTTAVFLGCSYYATLEETNKTKMKYTKYVGSCILLAMFLTISKAEIPLFIIIGTILILVKKEYTRTFIIQNSISAICAIVLILLTREHYNSFAIICALIGIVLSSKIKLNIIKSDKTLLYIWIVAIIMGIIGVLMLSYFLKFNIFITMYKRFDYMVDGMKLLKGNCLIGIGPGAWKYYQYKIQSTGYSVSYLHNGWIQFLIENGIIFVSAYIAVCIMGLIKMVKNKNHYMAAMLLLIMIHSFIDINFSFGTILIVCGLMLGNSITYSKEIKLPRAISVLSVLVSTVFVLYTCCDFYLRDGFERAYINKDFQKAHSYARRLNYICPYDSNLKVSLAAVDSSNAKKNLELAIKLSPLDKDIMLNYISYLASNNNTEVNFIDLFTNYIELAPKQEKTYIDVHNFSTIVFENKLCSEQDYNEINLIAERRRKNEGVIDRNELLHELTK